MQNHVLIPRDEWVLNQQKAIKIASRHSKRNRLMSKQIVNTDSPNRLRGFAIAEPVDETSIITDWDSVAIIEVVEDKNNDWMS
jgi:hypothetical protein